MKLSVLTAPGIVDMEVVLKEVEADEELQHHEKISERKPNNQWANNHFLCKGKPSITTHFSQINFERTFELSEDVQEDEWGIVLVGMKSDIKKHVEQCDICQQNKTESLSPTSLLQLLPLSELIQED